jgi:hypothetical protein
MSGPPKSDRDASPSCRKYEVRKRRSYKIGIAIAESAPWPFDTQVVNGQIRKTVPPCGTMFRHRSIILGIGECMT